MRKKVIQEVTFRKGTAVPIQEIKDILEQPETNVLIQRQTIYDDKSQSVQVVIHFPPKS